MTPKSNWTKGSPIFDEPLLLLPLLSFLSLNALPIFSTPADFMGNSEHLLVQGKKNAFSKSTL